MDNPASLQLLSGTAEWDDDHKRTWRWLEKIVPHSESVTFAHKLLEGDVSTAINGYANAHSYDFIVLGTHGRSGLSRALMGSVAESVVRSANSCVVTVKPTK